MAKGIGHYFMMRATLALLVLSVSAITGLADSPSPNTLYTATSSNGLFKADFLPAEEFGNRGEGRVYKVSPGSGKLLYIVSWYAQGVEIANDGHAMVRPGPWASDRKNFTDVALSFYYDGKFTRSYKVRDLLKNTNSVDLSVSHYIWEACQSSVPRGFSRDGKKYTITLTDKTVYEFSTLDGSILATRQDPKAKSWKEVWKEQEAGTK